jgi:hypothetical protein
MPSTTPEEQYLPYVALLMGWPLLAATFIELCQVLGGWRTLLGGAITAWLSTTLGHALLPLGGYDLPANADLYLYSLISGIVFMIAVTVVRGERGGESWSHRLSAILAVAFLMLAVLFGANRDGRLALGPALTGALDGTRPTLRTLYESRWITPDAVCAVEVSHEQEPGGGRYVTVLSELGDGFVIDLADASVRAFDLVTPIVAALPGAPRPIYERGSSAFSSLEFRGIKAPGDAGEAITITGQAQVGVRGSDSTTSHLAIRFSATLDPAKATVTGATAAVCELSQLVEPVFIGTNRVADIIAGPAGSSRQLRGDRRGVSLYEDGRLAWRLTMPLGWVGSPDNTIAWARPTADGGTIFAVERMSWRQAGARGCTPDYPTFSVFHVAPSQR